MIYKIRLVALVANHDRWRNSWCLIPVRIHAPYWTQNLAPPSQEGLLLYNVRDGPRQFLIFLVSSYVLTTRS